MLSSAAFATQGLNNTRRMLGGLLEAVDEIVLGVLDGSDYLVRSNITTELATRAVTVIRSAWTSAINAAKDSLISA